jgi:hypothetical protein
MTVILSQKVGNEGRARTCSGTCHGARKPKCACICGGRYHGITRGGGERPKNIEEAETLVKRSSVEQLKAEVKNGSIKTLDYYAELNRRGVSHA